MNIRQVHLDEWDTYPGKGVADGHAGMGIRGRVEDYEIYLLSSCLLDSIDQPAFMVALEALSGDAGASGVLYEVLVDVLQ